MIRRQTRIRTTAPMTAQTIWPYHMVQKEPVAPSLPSSQPPTTPPSRPMMMFQMSPPFSLMTKNPASQPAMASEEQGDENVHGFDY